MEGSTRGDGTHVPAGAGRTTRRTVLGLGYAAVLAAVSGCGLRLDLPPPPPPVPTRRPVPDEALLIALVQDLVGLQSRIAGVSKPGRAARTLEAVDELLAEQLTVVTGRLTNDGVPTDVIHPTSTPTPQASVTSTGSTTPGSSAPSAPATVADVAADLGDVEETEWAALAGASSGNRELTLSVRSVHLAGADLLGAERTFGETASAVRPALVERTQPLVYGFEVVAAQTDGNARTRALAARDAASDLLHALGGTAGSAPGGWALPFPVTTPKEAARLGQHLLETAIAATTTVTGETADAASLEDVGTWSGRVQALAARWGLPLRAFPGMTS